MRRSHWHLCLHGEKSPKIIDGTLETYHVLLSPSIRTSPYSVVEPHSAGAGKKCNSISLNSFMPTDLRDLLKVFFMRLPFQHFLEGI